MFKNVATSLAVFAFDVSTGLPKTGDAANLTCYVNKDYAGSNVLADTGASEIDSTKAPGWYLFDLAQAETNADSLLFTGKSTTANISVVGREVFTTPAYFSDLGISATGYASADALQINSSANAAANLARGTLGVVLGAADTGSTTTSIVTSSLDPAAAVTDQFKGKIVTFDRATTTANLRGQASNVTASTAGGVLTVAALTDAPVSGDTFTIT